jgi:hypothetical protein
MVINKRKSKMKKPAIISKNHPVFVCDSLNHLIAKHRYIGFEDDTGERYFIVRDGEAYGLAVNPEGTYGSLEEQERCFDGYFIFETYEELCQWLGKTLL